MTDHDLEQLLDRALARRLEPLVRLVEQALRQRDALTPRDRVLAALASIYGAGAPFISRDVVELLSVATPERQELRKALHLALGGKAITPERVGILLRAIVKDGGTAGDLVLVAPAAEGNSTIWMLDRVGA